MNLPGIQWSGGEAAALNEFLNSAVGKKWLGIMLTRKPRIDLTTTEKAALSGAFAAGYEHLLLVEMASLRNAPVPETASVKGIDPTRD
jgi:hypothetical protein